MGIPGVGQNSTGLRNTQAEEVFLRKADPSLLCQCSSTSTRRRCFRPFVFDDTHWVPQSLGHESMYDQIRSLRDFFCNVPSQCTAVDLSDTATNLRLHSRDLAWFPTSIDTERFLEQRYLATTATHADFFSVRHREARLKLRAHRGKAIRTERQRHRI